MSGKAQLIKSNEGQKLNPTGKWYVHDQIKPFIMGIETGNILQNVNAEILNSLISGVPSPWARVKLFWFAFDYLQRQEANIKTAGLIEFYKILIDEWKGLIALIALYPDRVSFSDPVFMNSNNKDLYEISGAFGRMLMDDYDLWTNQQSKLSNRDELPFIQLLKYENQLIGATSPFSIVFTGVDYSQLRQINDVKWYRGGKFEEPTNFLDRDKFQKLYLFIKNINDNFSAFETSLNTFRVNNKLDLSGLKKFTRQWQKDIEKKEAGLELNGTVAKYINLSMPFKGLLASEQKVFQRIDGTLTFIRPEKTELKAEIHDLQTLLKEDKKVLGWVESSDYNNPLSKAAVYYLRINDVRDVENPIKYFTLPLSMDGIKMFNKDLDSLIGFKNKNFNLSGTINEQGNLIIELTVEIDGRPQKLNPKEYEIEWATLNNKVIMWPDFISDNWDSYYLYSEFPLNVQGIKFVPFFKECQTKLNDKLLDTQKFITILRPNGNQLKEVMIYSNSNEKDIQDSGIEITNLVTYPVGQVSQEMHKYDVIKSNKPIAGLEVRIETAGRTQIAGYLIVKNPDDESMGNKKIVDLTNIAITKDAIVGIDFGSNNSCIHYTLKSGSSDVKPILFKNRRLALVGIDADNSSIAERDELLFFSNESTVNGQIKSWLHEHDLRYIGPNKEKEIAGGVPVNEKNILVKEMDREKITTQAGVLHYNMKWLSDTAGLSKKTAYLKALWLSVCADLYTDKCRPVELRWSFPGSMSSTDQTQYNTIYNVQLPSITPILDNEHSRKKLKQNFIIEQTEAEAVCKYALSQNYGLNNNLFLGIDVGGSTSDILILAKDINSGNEPKLFKQSSVRIAAGVFFDAIMNSHSFRKSIYDYHQQQKRIKVENIREILSSGHKAPFYLNSVFDQLTDDDFALFYTYIGKEASFVFALPAFVTGLLLFYAGKLAAKTIKENNLNTVKEIHLLPFGKGGRLFHWLQTFPGSTITNNYFETSFRAGFGDGAELIRLKYRNDITVDNKSEVSKGLVVETNLIYDSNVRFESDIFAEKNIRYLQNGQFIDLNENDVVSNEYFENVGQFEFPEKLENFELFLRIFIDFIGPKAGLVREIASLENRSKELPGLLSAFIQNDSEYKKARNEKQITNRFEYRFPIFMAAGLCYLEKILIPEVFKS
jgi:hypothetical protein